MIRKTAYAVQMSFDVSDSEKQIGEKAEKHFEHLLGLLENAKKHFNILYEPFKENQNIDSQETVKNRVALREYRDQIIENFNDVKKSSLQCYKMMNYFASDTATHELMEAFTSQLDDVETQVNRLIKVFSNLQSKDFQTNIIAAIDAVKKQCAQLTQLVKDRILDHIDTNILAKNWVSTVTKELQEKVDEKVPMLVQLFQERQNALNGGAPRQEQK